MSLFANLRVTTNADRSVSIGWLDIQRQEILNLADPGIADVVSTYVVRIDGKERATVRHRYGDGAWLLLRKALDAAIGPAPSHEDPGTLHRSPS